MKTTDKIGLAVGDVLAASAGAVGLAAALAGRLGRTPTPEEAAVAFDLLMVSRGRAIHQQPNAGTSLKRRA